MQDNRLVVFYVLLMSAVSSPASGQPPPSGLPSSPAPMVEAIELDGLTIRGSAEGDERRPADHPPIHTIPPMPMPVQDVRDASDVTEVTTGMGVAVSFDPAAGEETRAAGAAPGPASPNRTLENGYVGAYDHEIQDVPATFGNMDLIAPARRRLTPWRMNVKIVMQWDSRFWVCSGTLLDPEVVLTAGHCIHDTNDGRDGWADRVWVYPGWDGSQANNEAQHYGAASAHRLHSITGWTVRKDSNFDIGEISLTRAVGALTGWFGNATGGGCAVILPDTYHNASYPAGSCGVSNLHTGRDMYYWFGNFDSCPGNLLRINNSGSGCFSVLWGGMSGSGAYYQDGNSRYVHAVVSHSQQRNGVDINGNYSKLYAGWRENIHHSVVAETRGSTFDLQALATRIDGPTTIEAGGTATVTHYATNPTNGTANRTWRYGFYLSDNNDISTSDTLLSTWTYTRNFSALHTTRVTSAGVRIPANTRPGNYYLGVVYDSSTDSNAANNDTDAWDAVRVTIAPGGPGSGGRFTDDPVRAGRTMVKTVHITELRERIDRLRTHYGASRFAWAGAITRGAPIRATHLLELRQALNGAYNAAGRTPPTYSVGLVRGLPVRAQHVNELRRAIERLE